MTDEHRTVTAHDVADDNPRFLANLVRALSAKVDAGFELLGERILTAIDRMEARLDGVKDDVADLRRRTDDHERRLSALEKKPKRKARK